MNKNREIFIKKVSDGSIIKESKSFRQLAKENGYVGENAYNLCKKDYYKALNSKSDTLIKKEETNLEKLTLRRAWQAQTPNGIEILKSYENNINVQELKEFRENFLKDLVNSLNISKSIIHTRKTFSNKIHKLFFISDLHVGMKLKNNKWDYTLALNSVLEILNYVEENDNIYIALTGDIIDGLNASTATKTSNHTLLQNMSNSEQILGAVKILKQLFDLLHEYNLESITFISTSDSNHSGDIDLVIAKILEMYLNLKYPEVKTLLSDEYWNFFKIANYNFAISHGKDSNYMKFGLPLNLDHKIETYLTQLLNKEGVKLCPKTTLVISGDLHTESFSQGKFFKYFKLPAASPASDWVKFNYGDQVSGIKVFEIKNNILNHFTINL